MTMQARRLEGRVALVTGAARGIGRAIADRLTAEGAAVWYTDIDGDEAASAAGEAGSPAVARALDITDRAAVDRVVGEIETAHGRLDILVNNAAILGEAPTAALDESRFREVLDVNLTGALSCVLASVDLMGRTAAGAPGTARGGRILNIASIMGLFGSRDSVPYSAAKAALVNMTRCLACDYADRGITVNAIAPGFIDTRMALRPDGSGHEHDSAWFRTVYLAQGKLPLGRAGQPEDIAGPAFFLCGDDSAYVTGQVLLVDGGVSATF